MKKLLIVLLAVITSNVSASVIDSGTFVTDTSQELDFLKLTDARILGTSVGQVEALLLSDATLFGFRYATASEVLQLFSNFTTLQAPEPTFGNTISYSPSSAVGSFVDLVGINYLGGNTARSALGATANQADPHPTLGARRILIEATDFIDGLQNDFIDIDSIIEIQFSSTSSSYLVRDNISAVPVPAAAWLFGSGLIGLIGVARRK